MTTIARPESMLATIEADEVLSWRTVRAGGVMPLVEEIPNTTAGASSPQSQVETLMRPAKIQRPVVRPPKAVGRRTFVATARWEGVVTERFDSYFTANVVDLRTDESAAVEFDLAEVSPHDLSLCEPGALFYWTIGYETKDSGQRSRVSVITFRRVGNVRRTT